MTSFKILENDNYEIVLVEILETETKQELHQRERFYIENNDCVNKNIPTRTKKEYYVDNIETFKEYGKRVVKCVCGYDILVCQKARHMRTKKHLKLMEEQKMHEISSRS
jgi:fibrillarin-like rRNA methylase